MVYSEMFRIFPVNSHLGKAVLTTVHEPWGPEHLEHLTFANVAMGHVEVAGHFHPILVTIVSPPCLTFCS